MRETILNFTRSTALLLLLVASFLASSCATKQETAAIVDDPNARRESSIPWNEQQDWEVGANMPAGMRGSSDGP